MDQEPEPAAWPPAPEGMVPTPQISPFKPAPIVWVIALIGIVMTLDCLSALLDPVMMNGGIMADANVAGVANLVAFFQSCFQIAAFIAFLVWFYRVYRNLSLLGSQGLPYTPGWVVAWFFVPVLNLYQPYKMAQIIWKASAPHLDPVSPASWRKVKGGAPVGVWWGLTIVSQCAVAITTTDVYQSHTIGRNYYEGMIYGNLLSVAAGMATIAMIRAVFLRQNAKAAAAE